MKTILVTGGAGYIGSHTVVELYKNGYKAIIIDNFSNSHESVISGLEEIVGEKIPYYDLDITDINKFAKLMSDIDDTVDGIIHFAAYKSVPESVSQPLKYYRNNVTSMSHVIMASAARDKTIPIVFSSSCSVYGNPEVARVTEDTPFASAESPYAHTKQICEDMLKASTKAYGIKGISLRYFNPIGAHPSGIIGENPKSNADNLIPRLCKMALDREPVTVFGIDYPTRDGSCIRDYIYIMDLANAHVKALEYSFKMEENYDVFNVGTGKGTSVLELLNDFEKATETPIILKPVERRPGDVVEVYADTTKINDALEWKSKYDLVFSLETSWAWALKLYRHKVNSDIY
jgi:UDP-glucose 4-epimerase